jgi:lipopolysaccharide transport system ATP-binding protein
VKRYSSGMYVRLAFAVAAFLEPDILIVDEVLAVGDMEFQNKCIGRMKDVSLHEGRTVLFVSHNMAAIQNLCTRALLMDKGKLVESGTVPDIMDAYLKKYAQQMSQADLNNVKRLGNKSLIFEQLYISQDGQREIQNIETFKEVQFNFHFKISPGVNVKTGRIDIGINDIFGVRIAWMSTSLHNQSLSAEHSSLSFDFKNFNLAPGSYNCTVYAEVNGEIADYLFGVMGFNVVEKDYYQTGRTPPKNQGNFLIQFESHLS